MATRSLRISKTLLVFIITLAVTAPGFASQRKLTCEDAFKAQSAAQNITVGPFLLSGQPSQGSSSQQQSPGQSQPSQEELSTIHAGFQSGWETCYIGGYCHDNVIRLYRHLRNLIPGLPKTDFKVLFITPLPQDFDMQVIMPLTPRGNAGIPPQQAQPVLWRYHVVLQYKNKILDLDYTGQAVIMPIREYFQKNFLAGAPGQRPDGLQVYDPEKIMISVIPGDVYLPVHPNILMDRHFISIMNTNFIYHYMIKNYPDGEPLNTPTPLPEL